jgi:hypothetical protein
VSDPIGLQGHEPSALPLIEPARQDVDLLVQRRPVRMFLFLAIFALTLVDFRDGDVFLATNGGFPQSEHHTLRLLRNRLPVAIKPGS